MRWSINNAEVRKLANATRQAISRADVRRTTSHGRQPSDPSDVTGPLIIQVILRNNTDLCSVEIRWRAPISACTLLPPNE